MTVSKEKVSALYCLSWSDDPASVWLQPASIKSRQAAINIIMKDLRMFHLPEYNTKRRRIKETGKREPLFPAVLQQIGRNGKQIFIFINSGG